LRRVRQVEAEFYAQREQAVAGDNPDLSGNAALAHMFSDPKESAKMRLMMRYVTAAERAWNKALADFEKVRAERMKRELEANVLAAMAAQSRIPIDVRAAVEASRAALEFVSKNDIAESATPAPEPFPNIS